NMMNTKSITQLFVVNDKKPVGIIHLHDCLRAGFKVNEKNDNNNFGKVA
ncbi:MAG: CBS domain-containing protein, partial [Alphaproteobacteria bacterium]|nr:CBS domain-containing protein [Alphaproteobacteria bacterium]